MSQVKGKNTKPEVLVRSLLHRLGYRFRLHRKNLPGRPDIVLPKYRTVIFVHGCFWHQHPGCKRAALPKQNTDFWLQKLRTNAERDEQTLRALAELGWKTVVLWTCELKDIEKLTSEIREALPQTEAGDRGNGGME
jgi:DNA mismatch endonuclease (patch repair protein)